jgi:hypothetical protein
MNHSARLLAALCATLVCAAPLSPSRAANVMDQIGPSGAFFTGKTGYSSQRFGDAPTSSLAAVDNFSTAGAFNITNIQAALLGFNGFTSYNNVTGWEINIYSSQAAAVSNLNGDLFHVVLTAAQATLTQPFSGDALSALASFAVNFAVASAGTYYVSVIPDMNFTGNGQIGVYGTTGLPGSNPGDINGFTVNPGGGLGLPGNRQNQNVDFAYRITGNAPTGVPDGGSTALLLGFGVVGLCAAQRAVGGRRATATAAAGVGIV